MQNRYVGDIGDFGKYGLLRHITGMRETSPPDDPLHLGVVWYLFPDEAPKDPNKPDNRDGSLTGYLRDPKPRDSKLCECDPHLYKELHKIVIQEEKRDVIRIRKSEILPGDTVYYENSLSYPRKQPMSERKSIREGWVEGALAATKEADVVFVDPDNGITEKPIQFRKNGPKYVFMDDLRQFYGREQSLVIYHHLARTNTENQIKGLSERLQAELDLPRLPLALRYRRGTGRVYFIAPRDNHMAVLEKRLNSFKNSPWCKQGHFERVT